VLIHSPVSERQLLTGAAEDVLAAASVVVVVSAVDVMKEVALEAVSVADLVRLVSTVVSARVVVDSITVADAEAVWLAESVLLATDTIELEWLSGLHGPADAMPAAAERIKNERMATMMKVGKQGECEVKIGRQKVDNGREEAEENQ
jgi:hypothetical protein